MKEILKKEMNITFVYIAIFVIGIVIVFFMTSYINKQVKEANNQIVSTEK